MACFFQELEESVRAYTFTGLAAIAATNQPMRLDEMRKHAIATNLLSVGRIMQDKVSIVLFVRTVRERASYGSGKRCVYQASHAGP